MSKYITLKSSSINDLQASKYEIERKLNKK